MPARMISCVAVFAVCLLGIPSQAADRVALVIGNSKYEGDAVLRNPANDADAIEAALKELGFAVIKKKDLDLTQMQDAVWSPSDASKPAEAWGCSSMPVTVCR